MPWIQMQPDLNSSVHIVAIGEKGIVHPERTQSLRDCNLSESPDVLGKACFRYLNRGLHLCR